MSEIDYRRAVPGDVPAIAELYSQSGRTANPERILLHIADYPSVVAYLGGELTGFIYGLRFGPDVVELENLFVGSNRRNRGIGAELVRRFEEQTRERWSAIILINSMLYPSAEVKRPAVDFYVRLGYHVLLDTGPSKILGKTLLGNEITS